MKITDIKVYPVWLGHRNVCLTKVETDSGIYGWGESGLSGRELAVVGATKHFRALLIGKDPRNIDSIWQELYRSQYFEGGRVLTAAISAIDIALYDILGKSLGVPVWQLLGGRQRDHIECFITSSAPMGQAFVDDAKALADEGWKVIRATTGVHGEPDITTPYDTRKSIADVAASLVEARTVLGNEIVLGVDFHHRLSVAEAASFCQRMPTGTIDFLEEPIRDETPGAYQTLRSMVDVPFAIGEEFSSKWQFLPYIENDITNFARVDICNVGGFTEAKKVAAMAESHYIDLMPHDPLGPICTAATIHLAASITNFNWLEVPPYGDDSDDGESETLTTEDMFFTGCCKLDSTIYHIPETPGLGIDVLEEELTKKEFAYWEPPRLAKPDGSYTNW